jgi:hypothetical protein
MNPVDPGVYRNALDRIDELKGRLREINEVIYGAGAPLGSANYFRIRELASGFAAQNEGGK